MSVCVSTSKLYQIDEGGREEGREGGRKVRVQLVGSDGLRYESNESYLAKFRSQRRLRAQRFEYGASSAAVQFPCPIGYIHDW